ncbi:MAG TPA: HEAT repeat domain-containing protein [Pirellulaceae bacterium]|nr:HEAT repeat domain-containing protein [Pirellulaceae bacterium]
MSRFAVLPGIVVVVLGLVAGVLAQPVRGDEAAAAGKPEENQDKIALTWLATLKQATAQAQQTRRPILVVVGGPACPFCRVLEREMELPEATGELARWTLLKLDVEDDADEIRPLAVGPIPALRVLTPAGKTIAARDGAMSASDLALWLSKEHEAAAGVASEDFAGQSLSAVQSVRLVREFRRRDPAIREAAIRRLLPHPQVAAGAVLTAFSEGSLSARLAARELLEAWRAPVEGLDPWRPETLSSERLEALRQWVAKIDPAVSVASAAQELTGEQRKAAAADIQQMLAASSSEAAAIRERLARYGPQLLPEVYEQLQQTESDEARERLTALRYRLVAAQDRVLSWPGGIERLASTAAATRYQAVDELARQATAADEALLLELFSDPEPLVRELSLRALHQLGGAGATGALSKLLDDPNPNVRAAVLKQLAESAARASVPRIVQYVAQEKDADLLVHAVRVLRESPSKASLTCLTTLLAHESWRVRAEAAEAIGKAASARESIPDEDKADAYVALVELLEDEDAFVVSRAVEALGQADLITAVDPLAKVALRHPDLAAKVIEALTTTRSGLTKAEEHLRNFCRHENPKLRAPAIAGLCRINAQDVDAELRAALADQEPEVRISAASALFQICQQTARSSETDIASFEAIESTPESSGTIVTEGVKALFGLLGKSGAAPAEESPPAEPAEPTEPAEPQDQSNAEESAKAIRAKLPRWLPELVPLLTPLLEAPSVEERVAGALVLAAAGDEGQAMPVLQTSLSAEPRMLEKISPALYWLEWEGRKALFDQLVSTARGPDSLSVVASAMAQRRDGRAAELLWSLLARDDANGALAGSVQTAMQMLYLGQRYYDLERAPIRAKKRLQEEAQRRAAAGPRWQRLVAFSLLIELAPEEAATLAQSLNADEAAEPPLRSDALRVLLVAQEEKDAQQTALAALQSTDDSARRTALRYLARGKEAVGAVEGSSFDLASGSVYRSVYSSAGSGSAIPALPEELTDEMLLPLLDSAGGEQAAEAGYLLCRLERPEGLAPLLAYWRQHARRSEPWTRLVYQAVAALNSSEHVPILSEIYRDLSSGPAPDHSRLATLYWTIRDMTGPEVLALRKRMRDEVGMENLRSYDPSGRGFP